jgi:hypothetical protein
MATSPEIDRGNLSDQPQGEFGKDSRLAGQIPNLARDFYPESADNPAELVNRSQQHKHYR